MSCTTLLVLAILAPWWDDYPYTIQSHDVPLVQQVGCNSALTGAVDDPCWGIEAARVRARWITPLVEPLRRQDVRILTWVETFGTTHSYVAEYQRQLGGGLVGYDEDPTLPKPGLNHWSWQLYRPSGETVVRWLGLDSYFDDEPLARPWTRTHPRYGCPPMTYPDGTVATGRIDPERPDTARIYDAGCAKSILGELDLSYGFNAKVAAAGVTDHLIPVPSRDGLRYSGQFSVGKDSACPTWIDYARASARQLADFGVQGLWADNFSAWDSLGSTPLQRAFGDWSVAGWQPWLAAQRLDFGAAGRLPISAYLRQRLRELGGDDTNLRDPHWRDEAWLTDPVWMAYLCYKQQLGRAALQRFHDAFHDAAREAGIAEFGIQGNDIPIYSLGMPRPESLEMVSTEFSAGWNLFTGPRGLGLPPAGRIAPVIRAARVHARSRFVQVWYYLDEADRSDDVLFRKLAYELLANDATIQCYPGNPKEAGSVAAHAEVSGFVNTMRPIWGDRVPWAKIGVVYSADSQLAELTPGGMAHFDAQRHVFDLLGWGTWLAERHLPYDVVAAWDLTPEKLDAYRVLLLPTVTAMDDDVLRTVLTPWVRAGGTLIVSGPTGTRHDASRVLTPVGGPAARLPSLLALAELRPPQPWPEALDRRCGHGRVVSCPARGFEYYQIQPGERQPETLDDTFDWFAPGVLLAAEIPREVELVPHVAAARHQLFIDLANLAPAPLDQLSIRVLARSPGALTARLCRPGREPVTVPLVTGGGAVTIGPLGLADFATVVLEGWVG